MKLNKNDALIRTSIWKANNYRCFYCSSYVFFKDLEIDHIIPERISESKLLELKNNLNLDKSFNLDSLENLVPTHHNCNNKKSSLEFSENSIRYYREIWLKRIPKAEKEIIKLNKQADNDKILSRLSIKVQKGDLTLNEILSNLQFLKPETHTTTEPLVITFSVNVLELEYKNSKKKSYIDICNTLEEYLNLYLKKNIKSIYTQTEASERNGETISIRFAFWNFDINHLFTDELLPWSVIEVSSYSELYSDNWEDYFNKSIVKRYHEVIHNGSDPIFGLSICPECGSKNLATSSATDYYRDEEYYFIECKDCGWNEWTQ